MKVNSHNLLQYTLVWIFLLGWAFNVSARDSATLADTIVIQNEFFSESVSQGVLMLVDPDQSLGIEDAIHAYREGRFKPFPGRHLQFGYNSNAYWLHLRIRNELIPKIGMKTEDRIYVSVNYPLLDNVEFFQVRGSQIDASHFGDRHPFYQRYFDLNNYVFPLSMKKGEVSDLFLRVYSTGSVTIPIQVETERAFIDRHFDIDTFNGVFLGVIIGLCLYNLFMWVGTRKEVYALFALMVLSLMWLNISMLGFSYRFWPSSPWFQQIAVYLFGFSSGVTVLAYGMVFLKTAKLQPRSHRFLMLLLWFNALCIPPLFFISSQAAAKLTVISTIIVAVSMQAVAIHSAILGYRPARYYVIGQTAVIVSVLFTGLTSQELVPLYHLTGEVMKWCLITELMFFSFGLADLINNEKRRGEKALRESNRARQALLTSQIKLNEHLDALVKEQTRELEETHRQLHDLSGKDELTGLRNRRYFNKLFPKEYHRAFRENAPISLLVLDIDYFKQLNDNHGHAFGDIVLSKFGKLLQSVTSHLPDFAIRYGGEEFIILLPSTSLSGALDLAESVRHQVEHTRITHHHITLQITVSIGVASDLPGSPDGQDALLRRADELLYQAKQNGRNRVEHEPQPMPLSDLNNRQV